MQPRMDAVDFVTLLVPGVLSTSLPSLLERIRYVRTGQSSAGLRTMAVFAPAATLAAYVVWGVIQALTAQRHPTEHFLVALVQGLLAIALGLVAAFAGRAYLTRPSLAEEDAVTFTRALKVRARPKRSSPPVE